MNYVEILSTTKRKVLSGRVKNNLIEMEENLESLGLKGEVTVVLKESQNPYDALYGVLDEPITEKELKEAKASLTKLRI
ncbi:hypothetical protein BEH94_11395 [Candidatus Altiarchaeales archaeon WOR_SM1_SCG]|nr:hypothetical protein BEH94_11395 [Candidatus Altiarchaeales archaeon WOR_SM1_SCG]